MSIQIKLYVDDKVYGVLESKLSYNQHTDSNGRPHPHVFGGLFNIVMESTKDDLFTAWATHPTMMKNVKIVQSPIIMGGKSRTFELIDTHCIYDENLFKSVGNQPMKNYITLSPAILKLDGKLIHEKYWKVTDLTAKDIVPINSNEEKEEKPKKCIVEFDANFGEFKEGKFGFDKLTEDLLKVCTSDKEKLKKEYNPIKVDGEDYFPPWVSMRKDQTITLKVSSKFKNEKEYKEVIFADHPDFTFEPNDLLGAREVKITCSNTNENPAQVKVLADGDDAGAINFFYVKPKTFDLEWCFVEMTESSGDKKDLERKINKNDLDLLLKKNLNPSLIDVYLCNSAATIVNISEFTEGFKTRKVYLKDLDKNIGKYIERDKITQLFGAIGLKHIPEDDVVTIYFMDRKSINTSDINPNGSFKMSGGITPTGDGIAYKTLEDDNSLDDDNTMHEIMHAVGLLHTFDAKAKHRFEDEKTKNYMDYKTNKQYTWKWQWEKLHKYSKLR